MLRLTTVATGLLLVGLAVVPACGTIRLSKADAAAGLAIVLPADAPPQAEFAAAELQTYLERVFGGTFAIQRGKAMTGGTASP